MYCLHTLRDGTEKEKRLDIAEEMTPALDIPSSQYSNRRKGQPTNIIMLIVLGGDNSYGKA